MEIPKTLETAWKEVSKTGSVDKAGYNKLLAAAAPTGKNEEIDQSEFKFLNGLKSELEKKSNTSGKVPASVITLTSSDEVKIPTKSISEVPETLKVAWSTAISDGKITADDQKALIKAASPNWDDSELDDKEKDFLANIKALLSESNGSFAVEKPKVNEKAKTTEPETKKVDASPVVKADTKVEKPKVESQEVVVEPKAKGAEEVVVEPKAKGADEVEVGQEEAPVAKPSLKDVSIESDDTLGNLTKVKGILEALGDEDFAPLKGIVENRLNNNNSVKSFSNEVKSIIGAIDNKNPQSLKDAKSAIETKYNSLSDTLKNNKEVKELFLNSIGYVDSEITRVGNKGKTTPTQGSTKPEGSDKKGSSQEVVSFVDDSTSIVPESMKANWKAVSEDKVVTVDEYEALLQSVIPEDKDESKIGAPERKFLEGLKAQFDNGDGTVKDQIEIKASETKVVSKPAGTSGENKPVLVNWTGYTPENKKALKESFGDNVIEKKGMPILKHQEAKKVAQAFGVSNVTELQKMLGAKPDGQFGPETFFKAKLYVANELNTNPENGERLSKILDSLGNDKEVATMKESVKQDDGVPDSLRATWNEAISDGKLTKSDYEKLLLAAAPNKDDSEFDKKELEFIGQVRKILEENPDGVDVKKPGEAETETQTEIPNLNELTPPPSLKAEWSKIQAKGSVTEQDYNKLMLLAAPTKQNKELDDAELTFLSALKDNLEAADNGVVALKPTQAKPKVEEKVELPNLSALTPPPSLKAEWSKIQAKGSVTEQDYEKLRLLAAPNKKSEEVDQQEFSFLSAVKNNLEASDNGVVTIKPTQAKPKVEEKVEEPKAKVPDTLKKAWEAIEKTGKVNWDDYTSLVHLATPNADDKEIDEDELVFLRNLKAQLEENNKVIDLKNPPKPKPVEKKAPVEALGSKPVSTTNAIPPTLKDTWSKVTASGSLNKDGYMKLMAAAAPTKDNKEFTPDEVAFLKNIKQEMDKNGGTMKIKK